MNKRVWGIEKDTVAARQLGVDPKEWRITMMAIEIDVSIADDVESTEDEYFDEDYYDRTHRTVQTPQYFMFVRMDPFDGKEEGKYGIVDFTELYIEEEL